MKYTEVLAHKARLSYIRSKINVLIPSQIRALRLKRKLSKFDLAEKTDMLASRISAFEEPFGVKPTIDTLIKLAAAFGVGLKIEFVSLDELKKWKDEYSQDKFDVPEEVINNAKKPSDC